MAGGISEHQTVVRMKCMPACLLLEGGGGRGRAPFNAVGGWWGGGSRGGGQVQLPPPPLSF